ncbi:MAG: ABC transporter substrate-binding protein [Anaerolineae bacterium]
MRGYRIGRRDLFKSAGVGVGIAALTACGATPTAAPAAATTAPTTAAAAPTAAPTQPPAAAAEKSSIVAVDTGDGAILKSAFDPFMQEHPEITVEVIGVAWDGFDEKVDLLIAGGDPPAIWRPAAKRGYRYYADKGMWPDITDMVARDNYDIEDFYTVLLDFVKWDGKLRGFPSAHYLTAMAYNKTLFDGAGVALPPTSWDDADWTWDAYLEAASTIASVGDDPLKSVYGSGTPFDTRHSAWIFGGDYFPEEGYASGKPDRTIVNSPEVIDGWQWLQDLIYEHKVQPTPAESEIVDSAGVDLFLSSKIGIQMAANWNYGTYGEIEEFEWGIAPVPSSSTGRKALIYPDQWMMFKDQKYPDAAWEALKYLASVDGANAYYMGANFTGGIPSRQSMAADWASLAEELSTIPAATLESVIGKGIDVAGQVTASHAIVKFAEIYDVAISPVLDNLFLDKISAKEAAATMEPKIIEILAS